MVSYLAERRYAQGSQTVVFSVNGTQSEFQTEAEEHRQDDEGHDDDTDDRVVRHDPRNLLICCFLSRRDRSGRRIGRHLCGRRIGRHLCGRHLCGRSGPDRLGHGRSGRSPQGERADVADREKHKEYEKTSHDA